MTLYHVDRGQTLTPNQEIGLNHHDDVSMMIKDLYPDGFSRFGRDYNQRPLVSDQNALYEAFFELVRRDQFPEKPSRFQSLFCCEDLSTANQFIRDYAEYPVTIWEVEDAGDHRADWSLLSVGHFVHGLRNADRYWTGNASSHPDWEVLVELPTELGAKLTEVTHANGHLSEES